MLNTSLRRAARTCPQGSLPARPTAPSVASFTSKAHQRRHSSSKPPVPPNNGSSAIPASAVKQVGSPKTESKKPASEARLSKRRVTKSEVKEQEPHDNWASILPSVPSLHHLNPKDVNIAAFYATYRPLSVTGPGPKETRIEDVDKIFQPKPKPRFKSNPQGVIYTLSTALENLQEQITDQQPPPQQDQAVTQKADLIRQLTQHNDAASSSQSPQQQTYVVQLPQGTVHLDIQKIQNRFRPFNTPPAPTPVSQEELDNLDREQASYDSEAEANEEMQAASLEAEIESQNDPAVIEAATQRGRQDRQKLEMLLRDRDSNSNEPAEIVFNLPRSQRPNFFNPSQTYTVEEPRRRIHRVGNIRRRRVGVTYVTRRGQRVPVKMELLSVKRQRKLKMKKHKYKKLMRKTRNLRRRMEKL